MASTTTPKGLKAFVILNPKSGSCSAEDVHRALETHFACDGGSCDVHVTQGHEELAELARSAVGRGVDVVIAAGGDGTVSGVADGLVGSETPLGILPLGTANVLAGELGIPADLEGACALIAGEHETTAIDAMEVKGKHYFTQVGVGLDALMIRDTTTEHKRRFGRLAYIWTLLGSLAGFQPRRFSLSIDGNPIRRRASQLILANCGTLGHRRFRWGPEIRPDDGRIDVCLVRARSVLTYASVAWHMLTSRHRQSPDVLYFSARRRVSIATSRPMPVQADGEIIGETPVEVAVMPGVVRVVVPADPGHSQ